MLSDSKLQKLMAEHEIDFTFSKDVQREQKFLIAHTYLPDLEYTEREIKKLDWEYISFNHLSSNFIFKFRTKIVYTLFFVSRNFQGLTDDFIFNLISHLKDDYEKGLIDTDKMRSIIHGFLMNVEMTERTWQLLYYALPDVNDINLILKKQTDLSEEWVLANLDEILKSNYTVNVLVNGKFSHDTFIELRKKFNEWHYVMYNDNLPSEIFYLYESEFCEKFTRQRYMEVGSRYTNDLSWLF